MAGEGFEKFKPFILKKMLEDGNELSVFRLPRNQRKYAWGEKNRIEMWDDLKRFRENMLDDEDRYYFGNIVTAVETKVDLPTQYEIEEHEADSKNYIRALVFDGQQRLTTMTILASAIRDTCLDIVHYRQKHDEEKRKKSDAIDAGFNGKTGKTPVEEHAEALENSQSRDEYYAPYDEAVAAGFDGRTGKTAVQEHAEALEGNKTDEEYYQPFLSKQEQDEDARALGFNGETGLSPRIERRRAESAGQTHEEFYQPHRDKLAAATAAGFDGRTGKTAVKEHAEAERRNEDAEEYYRRIIFENFPEKISLDIQMNTQMIGGLVRLANVIDQEVIKSSKGLEEYDFQEEGKGLEARMRYLELTGRMKDDERLKWVQLKKSERQHHFRGENPNTGYRPYAGNHNIYNCYDYFLRQSRKEIQTSILFDEDLELSEEMKNPNTVIRDFYRSIFDRTILTEARVVGSGAAYRIFGTLNDRGISLFETDKLRNTVMSKLMEYGKHLEVGTLQTIETQLEDCWEVIWDRDKEADAILRHWYNASRDDVGDKLTDEDELEYPKLLEPIRENKNKIKSIDGAQLEVSIHRVIEMRLQE